MPGPTKRVRIRCPARTATCRSRSAIQPFTRDDAAAGEQREVGRTRDEPGRRRSENVKIPDGGEQRDVLFVLKYGGNAMAAPEEADAFLDDIAERVREGDRVVLVHGGGPQIDAALARGGIATQRVQGLRITSAATLAVTESVLCGTVNKALVRALARRGVAAAGISGQDAGTLIARYAAPVAGVSLGFVGEIESVGCALIEALLAAAIVPVVAPLGITAGGRQALNVNADSSAGAIAGALRADAYVIVTNVERVRRVVDDPATGIASLTAKEAQMYLDDGTFDGGMRPKMRSALAALERGARVAVICGSAPGALRRALSGAGGTTVTRYGAENGA